MRARWPAGCQQRGFRLVGGGTDTPLMLVDLRPQGLTGAAAAHSLERAGIIANMNPIPSDAADLKVMSGLRFGVSGATTRGLGVAEFETVGDFVAEVLEGLRRQPDDNGATEARVARRCRRHGGAVSDLRLIGRDLAPLQRADGGNTSAISRAVDGSGTATTVRLKGAGIAVAGCAGATQQGRAFGGPVVVVVQHVACRVQAREVQEQPAAVKLVGAGRGAADRPGFQLAEHVVGRLARRQAEAADEVE